MALAAVEPVQKLLKMDIDNQRPWLINKPEPGTEPQKNHTAPTSMPVARTTCHFNQHTGIGFKIESASKQHPIFQQVIQESQSESHPLIDTVHQLAREN